MLGVGNMTPLRANVAAGDPTRTEPAPRRTWTHHPRSFRASAASAMQRARRADSAGA